MNPTIPRPFAIAIDDMGWMYGDNDGYLGTGPYRLGLKRKMSIADYQAVIDIANDVGVRLQGLFILGELDKKGLAAKIPTILPNQSHWKTVPAKDQDEIMNFVKDHSAFLELGMHGVGHEYWESKDGAFKRAEWYNLEDKMPWPEDSIRSHIDCFEDILQQYDLDEQHGHSFPESFVPCAYSYYWNAQPNANEYSLGGILSEYGVRYVNTDLTAIPECDPPIQGGFDNGVHVMNRFNYGNLWYMLGQVPTMPIDYQNTDFVEAHWPNLLAQDNFLQERVRKEWVAFYREVNTQPNRYCSKNTAGQHSQFLYHRYTRLQINNENIIIDNTGMPVDLAHQDWIQSLVIKIPLKEGKHLNDIRIDGNLLPAYYETGGYALLYVPKIVNEKYRLTYTVSDSLPKEIVLHDTTNQIHGLRRSEEEMIISGRFYGRQKIRLLTDKQIIGTESNHDLLQVGDIEKIENGYLIDCKAINIQGVTAKIILKVNRAYS